MLSLPFQLLNDAVLSLPLMHVALLGWCSRHAFTSLAFTGLAYAADFPGYFLFLSFPRCHVDSSVNGLSVSVPSHVNEFVRMGQQKLSQCMSSNKVDILSVKVKSQISDLQQFSSMRFYPSFSPA